MQQVGRTHPTAPQVPATPFTVEYYATVGHPAGIKIIESSISKLLQAGTVDVDLEYMLTAAFVPMTAAVVGMRLMIATAFAFSIGE